MLIRWVTPIDKPVWERLADDVADIFEYPGMSTDKGFHEYMDAKIKNYEALIAIDRMSNSCMGVIGFSREANRVSWFGVFNQHRGKGVGARLLNTALRHLDNTKDITVETFRTDYPKGLSARAVYLKAGFTDTDDTIINRMGKPRCIMTLPPTNERHGGSFHYDFPRYALHTHVDHCPPCNNQPMPDGLMDITELEYSYATAERVAQGRLFGKCHILAKRHFADFEEIPAEEMAGFMRDVQMVGRALHKVTGAIKINYEIHSNSGPHIHCHLYPRYLDDDFPSAPIDYRITEPSPYESEEEYQWFVEQMRSELCGG